MSSWMGMLGMFWLLAFICLGQECQDVLRMCDGMHSLDLGLYSLWNSSICRTEEFSVE